MKRVLRWLLCHAVGHSSTAYCYEMCSYDEQQGHVREFTRSCARCGALLERRMLADDESWT